MIHIRTSGRSVSKSWKVDDATAQRLDHLKHFLKAGLNVRASDTVLLRKALMLLCLEYDSLQRELRTSQDPRSLIRAETIVLQVVAEGRPCASLPSISEDSLGPTYEERRESQATATRNALVAKFSLPATGVRR